MDNYQHYEEVMQYAKDIVSGKIIANNYRVKGCQRFLDDLKNPAYDFIPDDAEFIIRLIEMTICHQQGEKVDGTPLRGQPFHLLPFHKFNIYNLVGFKHAGTNNLRFTECLIFIPRKNIKTSFAGALAYALGIKYRKSGSKIYIIAAALKQALESFDFINYNIRNMGEEDNFRIIDNNNEHSISAEIGDGLFSVIALASNPDAQDSFNCNFAIADEMHAFKKPKQYTLFKDAMKAYTNKLMIGISTAGDDPMSFLAGRVNYAKKVLDKTIRDEQLFIFLCEADPDENGVIDYTNPKVQEMANPAYGESIRPEEILNDALQAQNDPQLRKDFFAKSLNVFTSSMKAYFDIAKLQESDSEYNWKLKELAKLPIKWYGGADLSKMYDLTGAALHGRYQGVDIAITHGFIPITAAYQKADEDNIPFFWWKEKDWLTLCNDEVIEYEEVVKWFIKMRDMGFRIKWTGYDRKYSREFILKMKKAGFKVKDQSQRYVEKTEAFREIEKQIMRKRFYYIGNKAYEYCISNVTAIEDSDDFIRYKKIQPELRIDLFDADVIACKQMMVDLEKYQKASEWLE
ncbi:MAG: terminase large subunit [Clostridiales Family XIII bacterium]|uniref:terminase large subunit n=1 Tax=Hominibacterium faecale TaxID=2839743 RepID=UPI002A7BC467|nr:terminase large subunit [Clostridiales Family XIII bacterium]